MGRCRTARFPRPSTSLIFRDDVLVMTGPSTAADGSKKRVGESARGRSRHVFVLCAGQMEIHFGRPLALFSPDGPGAMVDVLAGEFRFVSGVARGGSSIRSAGHGPELQRRSASRRGRVRRRPSLAS